jgi:hypothetical protein
MWKWIRNLFCVDTIKPDKALCVICPECNKECSPDKIWVYCLTYQDWMNGKQYVYTTKKGEPFHYQGWSSLILVGIDDVCMDKSNKHILGKLVECAG